MQQKQERNTKISPINFTQNKYSYERKKKIKNKRSALKIQTKHTHMRYKRTNSNN